MKITIAYLPEEKRKAHIIERFAYRLCDHVGVHVTEEDSGSKETVIENGT